MGRQGLALGGGKIAGEVAGVEGAHLFGGEGVGQFKEDAPF